MPEAQLTSQQVTVAAPAQTIFDLVAAMEDWPQFVALLMHAEILGAADGYRADGDRREDVVRRWFLAGPGQVRVRTSRRCLDPDGLRITLTDIEPGPARLEGSAEWRFEPLPDGTTRVELNHRVVPAGDEPGPADSPAMLARHAQELLSAVKDAAERRAELAELVLSFTDSLFIAAADTAEAYRVLYEADKWPERLEHVTALTMAEPEPGIQFFDMETWTLDGAAHTTRSVRVCLPNRKIVYKQIGLPVLLDAHTGHWEFTPTPEGIIASSRHTVTIKPSMLSALGEGTTVADARRYLRRVLSANSMKNLQLAKRYAEATVHA
jgi:C7-C12 aromatase (ARO/CYC)